LFLDPIARYFLVLAVILQILGYFWIRKIVDIEI
jgi:Flp pilus assembly protein TadB